MGGETFIPVLWLVISQVQSLAPNDCCQSVAISSSAVGKDFQEHQLGIYSIKPGLIVNDRPVYKQHRGRHYLYYWIFDEGRHDDGENWLVR